MKQKEETPEVSSVEFEINKEELENLVGSDVLEELNSSN